MSLNYELIAPVKWEGEVGHDSREFINYKMKFRKSLCGKMCDWEVSRRFKEFDALHKVLINRNTSFMLKEFIKADAAQIPALPAKSLAPLCSSEEIEARRAALELYIADLLRNPAVVCCYYFRLFIGEIE